MSNKKPFDYWLNEIRIHLVKTKIIKNTKILCKKSWRPLYQEGLTIRQAINEQLFTENRPINFNPPKTEK